jgi:hypothetical protein
VSLLATIICGMEKALCKHGIDIIIGGTINASSEVWCFAAACCSPRLHALYFISKYRIDAIVLELS